MLTTTMFIVVKLVGSGRYMQFVESTVTMAWAGTGYWVCLLQTKKGQKGLAQNISPLGRYDVYWLQTKNGQKNTNDTPK